MKPEHQRDIKLDIANDILKTVAIAGFLSIALIAPNALRLLVTPIGGRGRRRLSQWEIERALERLLNGEYLKRQGRHNNLSISLTPKGKDRLHRIELKNAVIKKPKQWDGRWRLAFFDIPQNKHEQRDAIRRKLRNLGFVQIQKSVYLHPYECYAIIQAMQDFYQIKPHFHYAVIEKIEHSKTYLKHFNLKPR